MKTLWLVPLAALLVLVPVLADGETEAAWAPFEDVARVFLSPRCRNCHPAGDRPLQHEEGRPHAMNISRRSTKVGLDCATCHPPSNAPGAHRPPGSPVWHLPPQEVPMVFETRSTRALCLQLKDPDATGGRSLEALLHHVEHDPLVLWAWEPGEGREPPPLSHAVFVERFRAWLARGAACPP